MANPLISFFVCAYNQEQYIRLAVEGAFAQTYSPLEIIISDDNSTDRTFQIIEEMTAAYKGPHRVVLNRNPKNVGIGAHVNRIIELCQGDFIVCAAGDDISFKDRTARLHRAWEESSRKAFSIYSNMIIIDSTGAEKGLSNPGVPPIHPTSLAMAAEWGDAGVHGCSHAFHRDVFDVFGPIDNRVIHEDQAIPFRSLILGTIKYLPEPLVYYRRHDKNAWSDELRSPSLQKRCQILRSDRAYLFSWLHDLRKAGSTGIIAEKECDALEFEVVERLHEKNVEMEFYQSSLQNAPLVLGNRFLGWKSTFRQMLRLVKRRWRSKSTSNSQVQQKIGHS